jgi:hypothetical protein
MREWFEPPHFFRDTSKTARNVLAITNGFCYLSRHAPPVQVVSRKHEFPQAGFTVHSPRSDREQWTTIVLSIIGIAAAFVAGSSLLAAKVGGFASSLDTAKTVTLWLTGAFAVVRWLYSVVLWRLFHSNLDINGRWEYINHYDPPVQDDPTAPMTSNQGWVEIRQTLDKISYRGARTHRNGVASTQPVDFKSLAFDVSDDGSGVLLYEIHRHVTHRSMEELRIQQVPDGAAPVIIRGRFRSLEPAPTYAGEGTYRYLGPRDSLLDKFIEGLRRWLGKGR